MVIKGKIGTIVFICRGVSELWLSKVLSFLYTRKSAHIQVCGDINAMTMKQVSPESSSTQDLKFFDIRKC